MKTPGTDEDSVANPLLHEALIQICGCVPVQNHMFVGVFFLFCDDTPHKTHNKPNKHVRGRVGNRWFVCLLISITGQEATATAHGGTNVSFSLLWRLVGCDVSTTRSIIRKDNTIARDLCGSHPLITMSESRMGIECERDIRFTNDTGTRSSVEHRRPCMQTVCGWVMMMP